MFESEVTVYHITQTHAQTVDDNVNYCRHFDFPDEDPTRDADQFVSTQSDVQMWHRQSRTVLAPREDPQPPTCMQDTAKTLEIYEEALYPTLLQQGINSIVEDNVSPHNNQTIRDIHENHGVWIVDYEVTEEEKEEIQDLVRLQTRHYRREQDKRAQMTKQTNELDRLPAWPSNSPDLNLIEVVWSWISVTVMVAGRATPKPSRNVFCRPGTISPSSPSANWYVLTVCGWRQSSLWVTTVIHSSRDVLCVGCGCIGVFMGV